MLVVLFNNHQLCYDLIRKQNLRSIKNLTIEALEFNIYGITIMRSDVLTEYISQTILS